MKTVMLTPRVHEWLEEIAGEKKILVTPEDVIIFLVGFYRGVEDRGINETRIR